MSSEEYLMVEARIREELQNIADLEAELQRYGLYPHKTVTRIGGFALEDTASLRIIGSILHDVYTSIENIFKVVADRLDRSLPSNEQWHKELITQMTLEVPGLRVALITSGTAQVLDPLRGFRHVFRNVYGFHLSPQRIDDLLTELPNALQALRADLRNYSRQMHELLGLDPSDQTS